jgi:hypothetical protein
LYRCGQKLLTATDWELSFLSFFRYIHNIELTAVSKSGEPELQFLDAESGPAAMTRILQIFLLVRNVFVCFKLLKNQNRTFVFSKNDIKTKPKRFKLRQGFLKTKQNL